MKKKIVKKATKKVVSPAAKARAHAEKVNEDVVVAEVTVVPDETPIKRTVGRAPNGGGGERFLFTLSPDEKKILRNRSDAAGMSMSHYLRTKALE